jgi:prepilin peptidase CpaA
MSEVHAYIQMLFQAVYIFCLCYAVLTDVTKLTIPNLVPLVLVGAFALFAALNLDASSVVRHLSIAGVVLGLGVGFFVAGWIGGGDVKLMTAVTLWMGMQGTPQFVLIMALIGAALAAGLFTVNHYSDQLHALAPRSRLIGHVLELARSGRCPYGVAIGIAGLVPNTGPIWWTAVAMARF